MDDIDVDGRIECASDQLRLHGYFFPWGTKSIACFSIRDVRRVTIGALTGRARILVTSNPRYWANLDVQRPKRTAGLIFDVGEFVRPLIAPSHVDEVESVLRSRAHLAPGAETTSGPLL
jgi:hypothetical protein